MDEQLAKLVIGAGAAVGVVVWLLAVQLYRKMADAPAIEHVEAGVGNQTPEDALRSVAGNFARFGPLVRLERPSPTELIVHQAGIETTLSAFRSGGQTMLAADVNDQSLRRKMQLVLAAFVLLIMPITIVGVAAALWHFAAPSPTSAVRWQSLQVLQMVHALWPPYLVYFVWKKTRAAAVNAVSNLLVLAEIA